MRKIIVTFFAAVIMFGGASFTFAQSTQGTSVASLQTKINELTKQLSELKSNSHVKDGALWTRIRKAPLKLKVNELGKWQVRTLRLDPAQPYILRTIWGEKPVVWGIMELPAPAKTNQLVFYSHKFSQPGTYEIQFTAVQGHRVSVDSATVVVE